MSHRSPVSWLLVVLPGLTVLNATAQGIAAPQTGSQPKQAASASAASLQYRSAFENYRSFSDAPVLPWKETNTKVREAGGWRAYAKEAAESSATDAKAPAGAASAANPHAGHEKH